MKGLAARLSEFAARLVACLPARQARPEPATVARVRRALDALEACYRKEKGYPRASARIASRPTGRPANSSAASSRQSHM